MRESSEGGVVTLNAPFIGTSEKYTAQDCCGKISYRLTAAPEDQSATMRYRVNNGGFQALGNNVPSALIEFSCCSENTIVIEVRAQNGQTRDYRLGFQIVD